MGSWNENCILSGLEIRDGEPAYLMAIGPNKAVRQHWSLGISTEEKFGHHRVVQNIPNPPFPKMQTSTAPDFFCPPIRGIYSDYGRLAVDNEELATAMQFTKRLPLPLGSEEYQTVFLKSQEGWQNSNQVSFPIAGIHNTPYHGVYVSAPAYAALPSLPVEPGLTIRDMVDRDIAAIRERLPDIVRDTDGWDGTLDIPDLGWGTWGLNTLSEKRCALALFWAGYSGSQATMFFRAIERMLTIQYGAALLSRPIISEIRLRGPQMWGGEALVQFNIAWMNEVGSDVDD